MNLGAQSELAISATTHDPVTTTESPGISRVGWAIATGVFLLIVADLPELSTGAWAPKAAVLLVLGLAGFPVLVWRAIGRRSSRRSGREAWAARSAIALVVVACASTLGAVRPLLAVVGLYQEGTGLLFVAAIAGCWALGTILGRNDRRIVVTAIIAGGIVNAVVGILQVGVGLENVGLPLNMGGAADGLLTNSVHFGALLAASLVLVAGRFQRRPGSMWAAVAVLGVGVGVSGARMPALLVIPIAGWVIWKGLVVRRRDAAETNRSALPRALVFSALSVGGVVAGSVLAALRGVTGVASQAANSTAGETFGQRFSIWVESLHAIAHRPLLGAGPGQFRSATSALFSLSFERQNGGVAFLDAHDIVLEYAVTTGLLGAVALLGWLALSASSGRGPLLGFAAVLFASALIEPTNVTTTPLMVLGIGAAALTSAADQEALACGPADGATGGRAGAPRPVPRSVTWVSLIVACLSAVAAVTFLVGDAALQRSYTEYPVSQDSAALTSASTANDLLAPWPDPASQLGAVHQFLALDVRHPAQKALAVKWMKVAVQRDPTNWVLWANLAQAQALAGNLDAASASARTAVRYFPYDIPVLTLLGAIATAQHQPAVAHGWFGRALAANPSSSSLRALYDGRCHAVLPGRGFAIHRSCT